MNNKAPNTPFFIYLRCAENRGRPNWMLGHPLSFQAERISAEITKKGIKGARKIGVKLFVSATRLKSREPEKG